MPSNDDHTPTPFNRESEPTVPYRKPKSSPGFFVPPEGNVSHRTAVNFYASQENTHFAAETRSSGQVGSGSPIEGFVGKYKSLLESPSLEYREDLQLHKILGEGGQGVVYLSERRGADGFQLPVALKFFSPELFVNVEEYERVMGHNAKVAARVAQIQHDNLLDVRTWFTMNDIRVMEMEWVDGFDLHQLMSNEMLRWMEKHLSPEEYQYKTDVVVTQGRHRPRLQPGIALTIIRDCLNALEALHNRGIVHSDIKPANIMLKKTGNAKIIDLGAAFFYEKSSPMRLCTPFYAAPEILQDCKMGKTTPQSDIASLGYVLIDLLSGSSPLESTYSRRNEPVPIREILEKKLRMVHDLPNLLPQNVARDVHLVNFCKRMIHPDLSYRFQSAQDAIVVKGGVGDLLRGLIKGNLASEFDCDIQSWISCLHPEPPHPKSEAT
ncbi:MAG: serine/threonine-protein kinase [Planctomycetia bacterium]|nr:serine/threonine-protein kinase [Planctomycetia bacterium]